MASIMLRITASLLILCSVLTSALHCDWLFHYNDLRNSSLVLVQVMGGPFTDQSSPIPFPYRLYKRTERKEVNSQLLFIRDSMKQIYDLYRYNNVSAAAWDPVKTTDFLESINRQTEELNKCVIEKKRANVHLNHYYNRLKNQTLHHHGGSREAWEMLRKETQDHLIRLDVLGNRVRATSRRQTPSFP